METGMPGNKRQLPQLFLCLVVVSLGWWEVVGSVLGWHPALCSYTEAGLVGTGECLLWDGPSALPALPVSMGDPLRGDSAGGEGLGWCYSPQGSISPPL